MDDRRISDLRAVQVQQRIAGVGQDDVVLDRLAADPHGEVGPADIVRQTGQEGQAPRVVVALGQMVGEDPRGVLRARVGQHAHQPRQFRRGESAGLGRGRPWLHGDRGALARRQFAGGELAVEAGHVLCGVAVPGLRDLRLARGLGRAPRPVGRARQADGVGDDLVHAPEMREGHLRVAQVAQGDPAGEPLRQGEVRAAGRAVVRGQSIGPGYEPVREGAAGQDRALAPPQAGAQLFVLGRRLLRLQERDGIVVPVLAPTPAQAFVDEAGMIAQLLLHPGDGGVDAGAHAPQPDAGHGQRPAVLGDAPGLALGGLEIAGPQQHFEPLRLVALRDQRAVALAQGALGARGHHRAAPHVAHRAAQALGRQGTGLDPRFHRRQIAQAAGSRLRRELGEPVQQYLIRRTGPDLRLRAAGEPVAPRPVRVGAHEGGDLLEGRGAIVVLVAQPPHGLEGEALLRRAGVTEGGVPAVVVDGAEGDLVGGAVALRQGRVGRRGRRGGDGERAQHAERGAQRPAGTHAGRAARARGWLSQIPAHRGYHRVFNAPRQVRVYGRADPVGKGVSARESGGLPLVPGGPHR